MRVVRERGSGRESGEKRLCTQKRPAAELRFTLFQMVRSIVCLFLFFSLPQRESVETQPHLNPVRYISPILLPYCSIPPSRLIPPKKAQVPPESSPAGAGPGPNEISKFLYMYNLNLTSFLNSQLCPRCSCYQESLVGCSL